MVFNSLAYLLFLPLAGLGFHLARGRGRLWVLLTASAGFYAALGAPELVVALVVSTLVTFAAGGLLPTASTEDRRRLILWGGIATNVAVLLALRYGSPVLGSLRLMLEPVVGSQPRLVMPALASIGVSFYTFQAISYLLDVYAGLAEPEASLVRFATYMACFPKLLQGPIERASALLPQFDSLSGLNYNRVRAAVFTFAWGLFKKVVVADRLSLFTDAVFGDVHAFSGFSFVIATFLYSIQIYADFSGYTDMAIGSAKLFGISLTQNFNRPYLATSVMEFWRRWHISFSRWLLDYLFKPLQMQLRTWKSTGTAVAILITFLASGAWHGASWNFVVWGGIHGFLMACSAWTRPARTRVVQSLSLSGSRVLGVWRVVFTFGLLSVTWVFFRAESLDDAIYVLTRAWSTTGIGLASLTHTVFLDQPIAEAALAVVGLAVLGALGLAKGGTGILTPEQFLRDSSASVRYAAYLALGYALAVVPAPAARTFIYFQF